MFRVSRHSLVAVTGAIGLSFLSVAGLRAWAASAGVTDPSVARQRGVQAVVSCLEVEGIVVHLDSQDADGQFAYRFDDLPGDINGERTLTIHDRCYGTHLAVADLKWADAKLARMTKQERQRLVAKDAEVRSCFGTAPPPSPPQGITDPVVRKCILDVETKYDNPAVP